MFAITSRLLLRPGWSDDAPALTAAVANEKIVRNLALLPWPYGEGDARWFLDHAHGKGAPEFLITSRALGSSEIIGGIGLHEDPEDPDDEPEIGYWIAEKHWGKGYATEAARAVIDIARHTLRLKRLKSAYFTDNPASGKVLRKLGFKPTGAIVPRRSTGRGGDVQAVLMALDLESAGVDPMPDARLNSDTPMPQMQMMLAA